jgi:hypothetical protein
MDRDVASRCSTVLLLILLVLHAQAIRAGDVRNEARSAARNSRELLSPEQWRDLDVAVDLGLQFLASQQDQDGSFKTIAAGQPGVTGLCVLAFLSRGHVPGEGPYGRQIGAAIDYVLATQRDDGLLCGLQVGPSWERYGASRTASYSHAIAGLMLGEVYGMTGGEQQRRIRNAIVKAIAFTRSQQVLPKQQPGDKGGWRYLRPHKTNDSDLSVTAWNLMFLRSARNAEFDVPEQVVQEATAYVTRQFDRSAQTFVYAGDQRFLTGAMAGAGIVALALGGKRENASVHLAGKWILAQPDRPYNGELTHDRYHYSMYYCSQAMFQLGGEYWAAFYPKLMKTLIANQNGNGSWQRESVLDGSYGNAYTSALAILALTPPYQLLPIYQPVYSD